MNKQELFSIYVDNASSQVESIAFNPSVLPDDDKCLPNLYEYLLSGIDLLNEHLVQTYMTKEGKETITPKEMKQSLMMYLSNRLKAIAEKSESSD